MNIFAKGAALLALTSLGSIPALSQEVNLPSSDLPDTTLNAVLSRFVSPEEAGQLADSLQRLWDSKSQDEREELRGLAQRYLSGDEDAGRELAERLNLQQDDVADRSVAVGLIVIGIGIMLL